MNVATKQMHAPKAEDVAPSAYAPAAQTAQLLARSQAWRNARLNQADMINTEDAAQLAGTNRETINRWIGSGRCIGLARPVRGYRLPRWQFEPALQPHLQAIAQALGTTEGWALRTYSPPHRSLGRGGRRQYELERVKNTPSLSPTAARRVRSWDGAPCRSRR